ncbi:MAG: DUF5004 domain-containing protein [Chitinophagales bacterium]
MQKKTVLILLVVFLFLTGCSDKSKLLVGEWRVNNLKYTREIPAEMQPTIDNTVNQLRNSFVLTYNADGTYTTSMGEQVLKGNWKLNWNSTKITATSSSSDIKTYEVKELTESNLTFQVNEGGEEVIFEMVRAK